MSEMALMQVVAALAWPMVVLAAIVVFFSPLRRILGEMSGFVGRSYYRTGEIGDDWTLDRVSVKSFCRCGRADKVFAKIKEMQSSGYSFAPIVDENGCVLAVFTPTCVQSIAVGDIKVNAEMDFTALLNSLNDGDFGMDVGEYRFVSVDDSVKSVRKYFIGKWSCKQDFSIVFVTQSGCSKEPVNGILTVWDVVKK